MTEAERDRVIKNIDRRVGRIEQILPTLATHDELQAVIAPLATRDELQAAIAPLATRDELQVAIVPLATREELQVAIAPLATREEMHAAVHEAIAPLATLQAVRDEGVETRRHFDVVAESLRDDIRVIAEGHVSLDARVTRLEQAETRRRRRA